LTGQLRIFGINDWFNSNVLQLMMLLLINLLTMLLNGFTQGFLLTEFYRPHVLPASSVLFALLTLAICHVTLFVNNVCIHSNVIKVCSCCKSRLTSVHLIQNAFTKASIEWHSPSGCVITLYVCVLGVGMISQWGSLFNQNQIRNSTPNRVPT